MDLNRLFHNPGVSQGKNLKFLDQFFFFIGKKPKTPMEKIKNSHSGLSFAEKSIQGLKLMQTTYNKKIGIGFYFST